MPSGGLVSSTGRAGKSISMRSGTQMTDQRTAARMKRDRVLRSNFLLFPQDVRRSERCVSAQIDLDGRREPTRSYPSSRRETKAVSERFISAATSCIHVASRSPSRRHTAAGFPANGLPVKASTWISRTRCRARPAVWVCACAADLLLFGRRVLDDGHHSGRHESRRSHLLAGARYFGDVDVAAYGGYLDATSVLGGDDLERPDRIAGVDENLDTVTPHTFSL